MSSPAVCSYSFLIPLPQEAALRAKRMLDRVARFGGRGEAAQEERGQADAYARALPGAPPAGSEADARLAVAFTEKLRAQARAPEDLSLKEIEWEATPRGLAVEAAEDRYARVNVGIALIRACQQELDAPSVGFAHHTFSPSYGGEREAGAVHVPAGGKTESMDLGMWLEAMRNTDPAPEAHPAPDPAPEAHPGGGPNP